MKIEIERKFLLKSLPKIDPVTSIEIHQYYLKNKSNVWERVRTWDDGKETKYIHTIKKSISKGVNLEDEKFITNEEYLNFKNNCYSNKFESKYIHKWRHIYPDENLYWEIDVFGNDYNLIIAEVEIPKKSFKLKIPKFISDVKLLEVTGLKQFNNRNLSLDIIDMKIQYIIEMNE